ncbi:MAG: hypothetical protein WCK05_08125 [Planctomycetota bacterium]
MNQGVSQVADSIAQRIPPQNEEAEEAVLGAMLIGFTVYQLRILSRLEFKSTGSTE